MYSSHFVIVEAEPTVWVKITAISRVLLLWTRRSVSKLVIRKVVSCSHWDNYRLILSIKNPMRL